jgi:hypothetical protein
MAQNVATYAVFAPDLDEKDRTREALHAPLQARAVTRTERTILTSLEEGMTR